MDTQTTAAMNYNDYQMRNLRNEIFWLKVGMLNMMLYMFFMTNEASAKSAWFYEDGSIKITDIFYKMLWSNFLLAWYYLTFLSANRWYYGEVMEH